ncbi:unnamed protein product [Urochloa humidicola]
MGIRGSRRRRKMSNKQNRKMEQPVTSVDDLSDDLLQLVLLGLDSAVCLTGGAATCKRWRRIVADLLQLVLLGLDSAVCLTGGAATCKRWRRIVADTDGAFLRLFRSLHHAPPPVGHFYYAVDADPPCSFGMSHTFPDEDPVFVPSSGSSAGPGLRGCASRQPISLDFVPSAGNTKRRQVIDSRGSLLLVLYDEVSLREYAGAWLRRYHYGDPTVAPDELVVCEPLTRRYEKIVLPRDCGCVMSAFLLDGDANDEAGGTIGMDNFRVVLVLYDPDRDDDNGVSMDMWEYDGGWYRSGWPYTAVFSRRGDGGGIECAVDEYDLLDSICLPNIEEVHLAGRTGGRAYWGCEDGQVMVLDERTLELSTVALPDHMTTWGFDASKFRVVGVDGGTVRIVCVTNSGNLEVRRYIFEGGASHKSDAEWVVEKRVELAEASLHLLPGRKEGYFRSLPEIITATEEFAVLSPAEETWLFSVDLRTMELEREHERNRYKGAGYPCVPPWPPVMRACVGD